MRSTTNLLVDTQSILEAAASDALARIRKDRERASEKLKPLLEYLESHLFDPRLNVNQLKKACGVRDNSIAILFHSQVGHSPKVYISDRRMETAATLLRETDLRIWRIADMVGYSGLAVFSKAFNRWAGQRPGAYRRQTREGGGPAEMPMSDRDLRLALAGALSVPQARALLERLHAIYGDRARPGRRTPADKKRRRKPPRR